MYEPDPLGAIALQLDPAVEVLLATLEADEPVALALEDLEVVLVADWVAALATDLVEDLAVDLVVDFAVDLTAEPEADSLSVPAQTWKAETVVQDASEYLPSLVLRLQVPASMPVNVNPAHVSVASHILKHCANPPEVMW